MIYVKERQECSKEELADFTRLALEPSKRTNIILERVELIAFAYEGDELISTRCFKKPFLVYKQRVFRQAQMERFNGCYHFESGYSYTTQRYRRSGLSTLLLRKLLAYEPCRHLRVFATTLMHNTPIIKVMLKVDAKPIGRPFETQNGMVIVWKLR